ncbi:BlaI/MecI/CopY family transcriptional regulator [Gorillibacterium timonense]|uniref:BlaI/MecI/CopY family transcriptional regulator n=1 Tax=Gorillibacterium timonense TaxID=1689269 RepID=UPI00071DDE52|nr:BlaI/MecI/CopY family transcriptional regulator [Gorillibacterium timonense]
MSLPRISEAEWEVMKIIWSAPPRTANEVIEELEGSKDWSPKTVRTLIKRLVEKQALGYVQDGRIYSYYPLVKEEECVRAETQSFLKRLYGGTPKAMLVHFLKEEKLSREDIADLKRILDDREEKK